MIFLESLKFLVQMDTAEYKETPAGGGRITGETAEGWGKAKCGLRSGCNATINLNLHIITRSWQFNGATPVELQRDNIPAIVTAQTPIILTGQH
jgi:hypothetical protein